MQISPRARPVGTSDSGWDGAQSGPEGLHGSLELSNDSLAQPESGYHLFDIYDVAKSRRANRARFQVLGLLRVVLCADPSWLCVKFFSIP